MSVIQSNKSLNRITLLQTRLYRPVVTNDVIVRKRIVELLANNVGKVLSLVLAPAGYGKSVAVSTWIEQTKVPHAWISLDEDHNDFNTFLVYLISSIQLQYPSILQKLKDFLIKDEYISEKNISDLFLKELEQIKDPLVIVFDDFHYIHNRSIHDLMNYFVKYFPENIHLVLISRRDPMLKTHSLKAYNKITEIRMQELAFNEQETKELFYKMFEIDPKSYVVNELLQKTEGWIVGLRLTLATAFKKGQSNGDLSKFTGDIFSISEFLVEEVLNQQTKEIKNVLLKTSLLDRFNVDLINEVFANTKNSKVTISGEDFIKQLSNINLFIIPLDTNKYWFRYHHLFQNLLQKNLQKTESQVVTNESHKAISRWFEKNNFITEAIKHRINIKDYEGASIIIENHRHKELEIDRWEHLNKWLKLIPIEYRNKRVELLISEAWICYAKVEVFRLMEIVQNLEELVNEKKVSDEKLMGEIYFFLGFFTYLSAEGEKGISYLEKSYELLNGIFGIIQGELELILTLSYTMCGRKEKAIQFLKNSLEKADYSDAIYVSRVFAAKVFVYIMSGELILAEAPLRRLNHLAVEKSLEHTHSWSCYMLGLVKLNSYEIKKSLNAFNETIEVSFLGDTRMALDIYIGQLLCFQFMNEKELVSKAIEDIQNIALDFKDPESHVILNSFKARINLLKGDIATAMNWANSFEEEPAFANAFIWIEVSSITQLRVLIAEGSNRSLAKAEDLLEKLNELIESTNMLSHYLDVLVLEALFYKKMNLPKEAVETIKKAVDFAKGKNWYRPFIEAGPEIQVLLQKLELNENSKFFMEKLMNIFLENNGQYSQNTNEKVESLAQSNQVGVKEVKLISIREKEIIDLIVMGLRNKEIAAKLYISENTVKKHISNIFQKIAVKNRVELVEKVKQLNIS